MSPQSLTPEAVYQAALEVAASGGLLSKPGSLAAVELNLALHSATPTIEAFHQYYENLNQWVECGSWVDWYGQVVCDVEELARLAGVETLDANTTEKKYVVCLPVIPPLTLTPAKNSPDPSSSHSITSIQIPNTN